MITPTVLRARTLDKAWCGNTGRAEISEGIGGSSRQKMFGWKDALLGTKGNHGVDFSGAACGEEAGEAYNQGNDAGDAHENERVVWFDAKQHGRHVSGEKQGKYDSSGESYCGEPDPLCED